MYSLDEPRYVGKTIKSISICSRGAWEGCCGTITFTDGSILELNDETDIEEGIEHE